MNKMKRVDILAYSLFIVVPICLCFGVLYGAIRASDASSTNTINLNSEIFNFLEENELANYLD